MSLLPTDLPEPSLQKQIRAAQIEQLYRQTTTGHLGSLFLAMVLTVVLWNQVYYPHLLLWLGCYGAIQFFRIGLTAKFNRSSPTGEALIRWGGYADLLTAVAGLAWGAASILFFPDHSVTHQHVLTLFVVGLSCAMTVVYAPSRGSYLPGILAMLLPLAGRHLYVGDDLHVAVGLVVLGLAAVLIVTGTTLHATVSETFRLRFEKDDLLNSLTAEKKRIEGLNEELKREIAEREHVQKTLDNSEARFLRLVETAKDVIWTLNMDLKYTYVSPSITSILGYTVDEIMALDPLGTLTPSSRELMLQVYQDALANEEKGIVGTPKPRTNKVEQYHKDGSTRWIEITMTFLRDRENRPIAILGVSRDASEHRRIDEMKTAFMTTAAHELRTPLTSIQGYSELLLIRDNLPPEEQRECLTRIHRQAVHLAGIVSDLLDVSRIESGLAMPLNPVPCNIGYVIEDVVRLLEADSQIHHFEVTLPEGPVVLMLDKHRIRQLLRNFVDNAVKYSPNGGLITLKCEPFGDCYLFSVRDRGMGMTAEQVEMAFDKFYRVDASNTGTSGRGLGMTVAKYIVEAFGGRVWIESEYGKGTTVKFTIPIRAGASIQEGGVSEDDTDRG